VSDGGTGAEGRLVQKLRDMGVGQDEIDAAIAAGELGILAVDRLLVHGTVELTRREVAERAGVDLALAERLWRAMGFADVPDDEVAFTEADVEMLAMVKSYLDIGVLDETTLIQMTRVTGGAMARIAEAQMSILQERMDVAGLSGVEAVEFALALIGVFQQNWERLFSYAHLRQLQAVTKRATFIAEGGAEGGTVLAVGFADLVGFTVLSQALEEHELAQVVDRFESVAYDTIQGNGGRVVKMIGDEVMFVAESPADAARIGLALSESYGRDETVSDVRVSVASGPVLAHEGDYFGPVVNLAARIVNVAYAGSVVVSEEVYDALHESEEFGWKPIRPRRLKGIGTVRLWAVTRPGEGRTIATEVASRVRSRRRGRTQ
jgi:adenylate cyclase